MNIDLEKATEVGQNVKALQVGTTLILVIDTTVDLGPSKSSGKMIGIGNSNGFTNLPGGLRGNVYVGKKA